MRYRFSLDLGKLLGARFVTINNEEGKPMPGLFIPIGINFIEVKKDERAEDKRNLSGIQAFVNFTFWQVGQRLIDAIKSKMLREGTQITTFNVPAYQVNYTLNEEKRAKQRAALAKKVLKDHPEWATQTDEDKTSDLHRAVSVMQPSDLGLAYACEPKNATTATPTNAPVAQTVQGYTPTQDPFEAAAAQDSGDDLPF